MLLRGELKKEFQRLENVGIEISRKSVFLSDANGAIDIFGLAALRTAYLIWFEEVKAFILRPEFKQIVGYFFQGDDVQATIVAGVGRDMKSQSANQVIVALRKETATKLQKLREIHDLPDRDGSVVIEKEDDATVFFNRFGSDAPPLALSKSFPASHLLKFIVESLEGLDGPKVFTRQDFWSALKSAAARHNFRGEVDKKNDDAARHSLDRYLKQIDKHLRVHFAIPASQPIFQRKGMKPGEWNIQI